MDNNRIAYNAWAEQYDTNQNRTRDLEGAALRQTLSKIRFSNVLEVGCGTGKNSEWLVQHASDVCAVDFSEEMLAKAMAKVPADNIRFVRADITKPWVFADGTYDLSSFSLVLEHIQNLDFIFSELRSKLLPGGHVYIGELHPFKQYQGSLARFDTQAGRVELECYTHNISEFLNCAKKQGLALADLNEWFDEDNPNGVPRILTLLFIAA
jgi:ubiquinone/menaquinone biosynthesis C-methylase UbiE